MLLKVGGRRSRGSPNARPLPRLVYHCTQVCVQVNERVINFLQVARFSSPISASLQPQLVAIDSCSGYVRPPLFITPSEGYARSVTRRPTGETETPQLSGSGASLDPPPDRVAIFCGRLKTAHLFDSEDEGELRG